MKTLKILFLSIIWVMFLIPLSGIAQEVPFSLFQKRRQQLVSEMEEGSMAVMMSSEEKKRSADLNYPYRQRSNFYYLTGYKYPESAFIIQPGKKNEFILFMPPAKPLENIYHKQKYGHKDAIDIIGADTVFAIKKFEKILKQKFQSASIVYMDPNDKPLADLIDKFNDDGSLLTDLDGIKNMNNLVHEMRLHKDSLEISQIKKAIDITSQAHLEAMKAVHPGMYEYEAEAVVEYVFRKNGASGPAFSSIIGSGDNANIVHYMKNNSKMKEGELVLMDIGAEYNMYAADITRTIPVDGKFSEKQETIYRLVLKALQEAIGEMEPGKGVLLANHKAAEIIMKGLQDLGLVTNPDSGWQKEFYLWYFFSHWLGIDVHDVGEYLTEKPEEGTTLDQIKGRSLKPGMVLTIEPSIFLPENGLERARALKEKGVSSEKIEAFLNKVRPVYKKYKGIGVRIEEDVLITEDGPKVLTSQLPRNVEAIENLMDKSSDYVSTDQ